jgi:hypothetical protein
MSSTRSAHFILHQLLNINKEVLGHMKYLTLGGHDFVAKDMTWQFAYIFQSTYIQPNALKLRIIQFEG